MSPAFSTAITRVGVAMIAATVKMFQSNVVITARKRSLGQGNIFAPVCHSVHRGKYLGRYPPRKAQLPRAGTPPDRYSPQAYTPPWAGTPPGRYTPWAGTPPGRYTPLGRYNPLGQVNPPPRAGTPSLVRYTPQSSACWEIQATSGWYASYWNAFLFFY